MKIIPCGSRVLVKPEPKTAKTEKGILLPDTAQEAPQRGVVLAIGSGEVQKDGTYIPVALEVGQHVLYGRYSGSKAKEIGDNILLDESDILAIIED